MWGYDAAAPAAVWMKSLTEARRCLLAVMAWSNLIWCLLCVLWGTCWNSLSTDESYTSVDWGRKTWRSVWAKKQCMALIWTLPRGDVLSSVSSSAGSRWKFLLDGKRNIQPLQTDAPVNRPPLSTDIFSWHDYPPLEKQGAPSAGKGQLFWQPVRTCDDPAARIWPFLWKSAPNVWDGRLSSQLTRCCQEMSEILEGECNDTKIN